MSDDIVARMRDVSRGIGGYYYNLIQKSADEIERLRELSGNAGRFRDERDEARREICLLREEIESLRQTISRSQEVSLEWIRETQNRARMMDGKLE